MTASFRAVVDRYLEEDTNPVSHDQLRYRVPRFLLNDIARFWRTMAVDFRQQTTQIAAEQDGVCATQSSECREN